MTPTARFSLRATIAFALTVTAFAPVAWAQEPGFLDRVFGGSDRAAAPAGYERVAQDSSQELVMRIDRLEAQIRQLTGVIEQLQHRNQQLEGQVRRMQEDTEFRLQELSGKGGPRPAMQGRPPATPQPPAPAAPGKRGDVFDPTQNPNAPGVPRPLGGGGGAPLADADPPPIGAPGGRDAGAPLDLATLVPPAAGAGQSSVPPRNPNSTGAVAAAPPAAQTPKDEFDVAYSYLVRKDYAVAEENLRAFLQKYPGDRLAPEATYWLGESLFQRQRFRDAAEAFLNVSTKFESSAKAPDALFRLGQSLAALGEREAACASLGEVLRKFPRASANVKQAVEREQKRVRC